MRHLTALACAGAASFGSWGIAGARSAAAAPTCGDARPGLESIATAEGLVIAPDGTIYFSQPFVGENQQFLGRYRPPYDQAPEPRWVDMGGNALGITLDPQRGVLYAGSRTLKKLLKVTLGKPAVSPFADVEEGINGVTLGADHAVYYGDQTGGEIYRVSPEGTKTKVTTTPLTQPNGLAFGPDGLLYVVSWTTPEITRLALTNAVETRRETFATLPQAKADGIAFDAKGRLYVTAGSTLYEISPDGKTIVPLGRTAGANIDFGAGALPCTDMYTAGNRQGLRVYRHDTPGLEVPWHDAPAVAPSPAPPIEIAFPGQYALPPAGSRFPVGPSSCRRFSGDDRVACLESIAFDYGRRSRFAAANAELAPPRPHERRVVFFGDSITDNWSKPSFGGFFPGKPYLNRGIGGQTTSQMLLRFREDVVALKPSAVVILAGTNDIAQNAGRVPVEVIEGNLASMAEVAQANGIKVVFASLLPVSDDKLDRNGRRLERSKERPLATLQALNTWMAAYAGRHGHVYLDYFAVLADNAGVLRTTLTEDGLHPNAAGYALMAPLAERAIARSLSSRPKPAR